MRAKVGTQELGRKVCEQETSRARQQHRTGSRRQIGLRIGRGGEEVHGRDRFHFYWGRA